MENITQFKTILHKATLIVTTLFGISSCTNMQEPETNLNSFSKSENASEESEEEFANRYNYSITSKQNDSFANIEKLTKGPGNEDLIKENMMLVKLDGSINSKSPEIGPVLSPDGKTLYFSRYRHPDNIAGEEDYEDIWYSNWDSINNKWREAKNIGAPLNNKFPNFINSISPDGNSILVGNIYYPNKELDPGLSLSSRTLKGWSFPREIIFCGKRKQPSVSGCQMSSDQKTIVLAYKQRKNNYGDHDIYVSFIKPDSSWSEPVNLGAIVNTKGTETAPFLAADNLTLYYTSNGLPGYGGEDIYVTHRLDDTWKNWSQPENLGPKVNTKTNQSFFSVSNGKIYFTSDDETKGNSDIYTFKIEPTPVSPEKPIVKSKTNK